MTSRERAGLCLAVGVLAMLLSGAMALGPLLLGFMSWLAGGPEMEPSPPAADREEFHFFRVSNLPENGGQHSGSAHPGGRWKRAILRGCLSLPLTASPAGALNFRRPLPGLWRSANLRFLIRL
ncbi:hypothetical protein DVJ83_01815 [Deinococcus wulumuqiensis]|uniref:Uncharacterized protein n=1 Tax=Deinococcus wulumuqiensis TaxID=980427 RepID=A0A345IEI3_9DEIO|nr:hypothetical protein DVJ83_01815 [Deinococcus wulumuqiensis]